MKINPMDEVFFGEPSEDFDPDHNRRVIERTMKKQEANVRKKVREHRENLKERAWASARYLKSVGDGLASDVEGYFGNSYLAHLKGQSILDEYKKKILGGGEN